VLAGFVGDLPAPQDLARDPLAQSTKVYDRTGTAILYQFEVERRDIVKYEQIPKLLVDAAIAAEDKSFWTNPGIDIRGLGRAVIADLTPTRRPARAARRRSRSSS